LTRAYIRAVATHVSEQVVTNDDLSRFLDTNDEWIRTRTGIQERRIFDRENKDLKSSDLGAEAARKLLEKTGTDPLEIDAIILGSLHPDYTFPATACVVQAKIGCLNAFAYDITAACAFLPFALNQADMLIRTGQCRKVLVIGAELISRAVDWTDRNTCVLFGDAGAAVLVEATEEENRGILGSHLKSDGRATSILTYHQASAEDPYLRMDGKQVFRMAVTEMAASVRKVLEGIGSSVDQIDLLVPHQANIRILEATGDKLGLPAEKVMVNVQKYGNTSSASIVLALEEALETGRVKSGDLLVLTGIGGGMSWGSVAVRW
jgi:3-oxoacyl-[acyl-carrier-protein] synthase-3